MPCGGICKGLSELFSRVSCFGKHRSSTESYYKELGDQDTLKMEDKTSDSEDSLENSVLMEVEAGGTGAEVELIGEVHSEPEKNLYQNGFRTMHKRRKKRLLTRSLRQESALLDDLHAVTVECVLDQSSQWKFNAFALDNLSAGRSVPVLGMHLFKEYGLISHFKLDPINVWKMLAMIEEGYHTSNPYHNQVHATDVTQAMHCFLHQEKIRVALEPEEIMASLIAAIAHDVDHPGVNQKFLISTTNHLAAIYKNTSVLENHHWRWAMSCVTESGIVDHVPGLAARLGRQISSLILATDITRQQEFLGSFKEHHDKGTMDLRVPEHRHLVLQIALKCADISNPCRPWRISNKWSLKVCDEFFRQGDYEKKLNLPVSPFCDRLSVSIPKIQTEFFEFVVTPLMMEWHKFLQNDLSKQMLKNLAYNKTMWEKLLATEFTKDAMTIETKDAIAETKVLLVDEEDILTLSNLSSSSEMLIPPRRSSLNIGKQQVQDRRLSVPFTKRQDCWFTDGRFSRKSSFVSNSDYKEGSALLDSDSRMSEESGEVSEKVLSSEKLLPDPAITSITTTTQATRIKCVLEKNSKLSRQQTFPPLEAKSSIRGYSQDETVSQTKTDFGQNYLGKTTYGKCLFSKIFTRNGNDMTENDDATDTVECTYKKKEKENMNPLVLGRNESAPVGTQLRENLANFQLLQQQLQQQQQQQQNVVAKDKLLFRRKSMPAMFARKEKKPRESVAPPLVSLAPCREGGRRRGSAPDSLSELRALVGSAMRQGRKVQPLGALIVKATCSVHHKRRSSLPVDVLKE